MWIIALSDRCSDTLFNCVSKGSRMPLSPTRTLGELSFLDEKFHVHLNESRGFWFTPVTLLTFGFKRPEVWVSPVIILRVAPLASGSQGPHQLSQVGSSLSLCSLSSPHHPCCLKEPAFLSLWAFARASLPA